MICGLDAACDCIFCNESPCQENNNQPVVHERVVAIVCRRSTVPCRRDALAEVSVRKSMSVQNVAQLLVALFVSITRSCLRLSAMSTHR